MSSSVNSVSALTRSQIFASAGRAAKMKNIDRNALLGAFGKKPDDVPAELKGAWFLAHRIARNYEKSNRKSAEGTAAPVEPAAGAFAANA